MKKKLLNNPEEMFATRPMYYRMDGTPYIGKNALMDWCRDFEAHAERVIGRTKLPWGGVVSTVWLGLDHSFMSSGRPLIFESMVFGSDGRGGDLGMDRYSTLEEAKAGHAALVEKYQQEPKPE